LIARISGGVAVDATALGRDELHLHGIAGRGEDFR